MTALERIQEALKEDDKEVSADVMADLLMDDSNSTYEMFEELAAAYVNNTDESYRKGLNDACSVLTGCYLERIADDILERIQEKKAEEDLEEDI